MIRAFRTKLIPAVAAVLAAVLSGAAAHAGELFVMPYTCSAPGGQPVLTPSSDQGYSVVGRKEQRPFSACSPSNPDVCKQWTVYRFDINCGGTRVPWVDVAAAVSATRNGRAFADNGRLRIEMPPRWAMSPDDPCSREAADNGEWHGGGFARFCAERRAHARGPIVEIPDGFAPMMGLDAIFVADGSPGARSAGPASVASSDPRPAPFANETNAPPKPPKAAAHPKSVEPPAESGARDAPLPPAPKPVERAEKPEIKPAPAPKSAPLEAATAPSSPPVQAAGTPMMPTVINKPNAPKIVDKPAEPAMTTPPAAVEPVPAPKPAIAAPPSPVVTASIDAPANDAPKTPVTEVPGEKTIISGLGSAVTPTTLAGAGLAVLALVALVMMRWRDQGDVRTGGSRDIATVSFEGGRSGRDLVATGDASFAVVPAAAAGSNVPAPPANIFAPRDVGSDMPQTREQALLMLGMGVAPEGSEAAIKKIVDGLRQSWHPDLAKSEAERQLRELRTKQINAAWAIITAARGGSSATKPEAPRHLPPNAA